MLKIYTQMPHCERKVVIQLKVPRLSYIFCMILIFFVTFIPVVIYVTVIDFLILKPNYFFLKNENSFYCIV